MRSDHPIISDFSYQIHRDLLHVIEHRANNADPSYLLRARLNDDIFFSCHEKSLVKKCERSTETL